MLVCVDFQAQGLGERSPGTRKNWEATGRVLSELWRSFGSDSERCCWNHSFIDSDVQVAHYEVSTRSEAHVQFAG